MPWKEVPDIEGSRILKEVSLFKQISGPILCRVLADWNTDEYRYTLLGSGGFLNFKGKYFVITNYHVVQSVPEEGLPKNIVVPIVHHGTSKARFTRYALDKRSDLAAFEIVEEDIDRFDPKRFITEDYAQINPVEYLRDQNNMVLLHGCPSDMSGIDYNDQVVQVTTFPYVTFAIGYQEESNIIQVSAHSEGLNEQGKIVTIPRLNGMSGSFAYTYGQGVVPYRLLGLLSNGSRESGSAWILPIQEIFQFIEKNFFQ